MEHIFTIDDFEKTVKCEGYEYGTWVGNVDNVTFEDTKFSLKDCINNYESIRGRTSKEIHFDSICIDIRE